MSLETKLGIKKMSKDKISDLKRTEMKMNDIDAKVHDSRRQREELER